MKAIFILLSILIISISYSQVSMNTGLYFAKEYSKDEALYKAKDFVMTQVIGGESNVIKYEIDPLAATSSGELTSLVYSCEEKNLSGLVLGFFGMSWNGSGVIYQAYAFKNLTKANALEVLSKIEKSINENSKYLNQDFDNNNIFFTYDGITFLIYKDMTIKIRVFWNGFDSEWGSTAFERTKRRFEREIKK